MLIFVGIGICGQVIGALNVNADVSLTVHFLYLFMFGNQGLWCLIWIIFYFMPLKCLSNKYTLLKLYSLILIIASILLCMCFADMLDDYDSLSDTNWFTNVLNVSNKSNYRYYLLGMMVGLTGMSVIAFVGNWWLPYWDAKMKQQQQLHLNSNNLNRIDTVSTGLRLFNLVLFAFVLIYFGASYLFFGWFGLYGTNGTFVFAGFVVQVLVWSDNGVNKNEDDNERNNNNNHYHKMTSDNESVTGVFGCFYFCAFVLFYNYFVLFAIQY